jgi:UDP-N-acetylglucosamine 4,6-dehydratase/5-epimerase
MALLKEGQIHNMDTFLKGKTILVTGGTGSIGNEIVKQALYQNVKRVIVFSRDEIKHFLMRKQIEDNRLETFVGDVRNIRSLEKVFTAYNIEVVYHAAAMKHVVMCDQFPLEAVETNIIGTQNVTDVALEHNVAKMINISTDKAVHPINVLGTTKFTAERIVLNANRVKPGSSIFACVRFGNVANSRGSVVPVFLDNLVHNNTLEITSPEITRFLMEIPDAVNLIIQATNYAYGGEIFILKMKAFRLGDLLEVMLGRIAKRLSITRESIKVNVTGLDLGEKLHEALLSETELPRTYELEDMYVISSNSRFANGREVKKVGSYALTSKEAVMISQDEIEAIILKYLAKNPGTYGIQPEQLSGTYRNK